MLSYNESIVFFTRATQKFEQNSKQDDADAGAAEHGFGVNDLTSNVPNRYTLVNLLEVLYKSSSETLQHTDASLNVR